METKEEKTSKKDVYSAREFIESRKVGDKFDVTKRMEVEIVKDVGHWEKGRTYNMFYQKAEFLIKKGLAKAVK